MDNYCYGMHQSFVTTADGRWIAGLMCGANVRGSDLLSSPAVPGKCRACDIAQIYPRARLLAGL